MAETLPSSLDLADLPSGVFTLEGLTRFDGNSICDYLVDRYGESHLDTALRQLIPQWLMRIGSEWSAAYRIDESENFSILQPAEVSDPQRLVRHAEKSLDLISQYWDGFALDEGAGKHVILVAATEADYYQYVCVFDPEGHHGLCGGRCITQTGYTHLVINRSSQAYQPSIVTHEIAHALLHYLGLPLWLEEGMVMLAEEFVNQSGAILPSPKAHQDYWSEHTLAGFWLGSAFGENDEGQSLAYQLARNIVYSLATRDKPAFTAFANNANWRDAGKQAAQEHLGHSLARCLPDFLQIAFAPPK